MKGFEKLMSSLKVVISGETNILILMERSCKQKERGFSKNGCVGNQKRCDCDNKQRLFQSETAVV